MFQVGQSFKKNPPQESYDAIVIGSGIGGLTAAALLARHAGKRVLVLERHYMPGGFTHAFRRRGYEWDVGVHYLGGMGNPRSTPRRLLDHVSQTPIEWASMGEVYDRVVIADRVYDYLAGPDRFATRMKEYFPSESRAIDDYLALTRKTARRSQLFFAEKVVPPVASRLVGPFMRSPFLRTARRTTGEVLDGLTDDAELRAVLSAQFGDYGLPPSRSSFGMHSVLTQHYLWGGFYPVGGASVFAAAIAPLIEEAGGRILYDADVAEILVRDGRAVGVRLTGGEELEAPLVVSDAGVSNTFQRLLPERTAESFGVATPTSGQAPSVGHLGLYVGLKETAAELDLPKANFWLYPGPDHDANVQGFLDDPEAPLPVVYVSFPSAKDPSFTERYPGRATIELITLAPYERFVSWEGTGWRKRGEDYEALKQQLADRALDRLDDVLPGVRQKIDHLEISTPLSTRHFAGYEHGEIYGLDHTPARFLDRSLRPRTPVPGLFLTGQDVATCGVMGAMVGGYLAGSAMLGRNLLAAATSEKG